MKILALFIVIKNVAITFVTFFSMLLPTSNISGLQYGAERPDDLIMSFSVISDTHVETTNSDAYKSFKKLLEGIKAGDDNDATVYLGDNVMNGQPLENFLFYSAVKAVMPSENNLVAMGNHDIGNGIGNYNTLCESFLELNNQYLKNDIEKPYYYKIINGCYMIFLASEDMCVNNCIISNEQYFWLKNTLDKAVAEDATIFVFNHHPIYMLEGMEWYSLIDLLSGYENLLCFSGHTHKMLDTYSFRDVYGVNTIFLPRSIGSYDYKPGDGVVVEVYANEIIVKGRNFIDGRWLEDLKFIYPLV